MVIGRTETFGPETVTVVAIEGVVPLLVGTREIIATFRVVIRMRPLVALDP